MKIALLSTSFALGLGLLATAPANAAPFAGPGTLLAPGVVSDVACRVVTKRVRRANGAVRVTRTRVCDAGPRWRDRRGWRNGRPFRPAPRPGVSIRINP